MKCERCTKDFNPKMKTQRFCSVKCRRQGEDKLQKLRRNLTIPNVICVVCGKEHKLRQPGCLTCSKECSKQYLHDRYKTWEDMKIEKCCKRCGQIKMIRKRGLYCDSCITLDPSTGKTLYKKTCAACNSIFETTTSSRKICLNCNSNVIKPLLDKKCTVCQEQFQTRSSRRKTCGNKTCKRKNKKLGPTYKASREKYKQSPVYKALKRKYRQKRKHDPCQRLHHIMSKAIAKSLKGTKAGRRFERLVGYTTKDLKRHLEFFFQTGMDWTTYGRVWEIDHVLPKSLFCFVNPEEEEFKACWAKHNLKPRYKTTVIASQFGSKEIGNQEKGDAIEIVLVSG